MAFFSYSLQVLGFLGLIGLLIVLGHHEWAGVFTIYLIYRDNVGEVEDKNEDPQTEE